jgi:hypothetical protein
MRLLVDRHAPSAGLTAAVFGIFWNALAADGMGSSGDRRIDHGARVVIARVIAISVAAWGKLAGKSIGDFACFVHCKLGLLAR